MANPSSKKAVYAALIGNGLIAVCKFAGAAITGSSAMLSEAIHSVVDTGNQILILHGLRRSQKPADRAHPFGYGMELYFWTFVVAILIFAVGAGISIYEGITKIAHPDPVENPMVNYIILGLAGVFEAGAWWVAYREFRLTKGKRSFWHEVRRSKDPAIFTVLFEDSAAMLGLLAAFIGIALGQALDIPELDGVASIVIGLILAATATLLAYETKGLLIGESANIEVVQSIETVLANQPGINAVNELLTMHMGPNDILLNLSLDFDDKLSSVDIERIVGELETRIRTEQPMVSRVFIEAQNLFDHMNRQAEAST